MKDVVREVVKDVEVRVADERRVGVKDGVRAICSVNMPHRLRNDTETKRTCPSVLALTG